MYLATHRHALAKQRDVLGSFTWDLSRSHDYWVGGSTNPAGPLPIEIVENGYFVNSTVLQSYPSTSWRGPGWRGAPEYPDNEVNYRPPGQWNVLYIRPGRYEITITGSIQSSDLGDIDLDISWGDYGPAASGQTLDWYDQPESVIWTYRVEQDYPNPTNTTPDTFVINTTFVADITYGVCKFRGGNPAGMFLSGSLTVQMSFTNS